MRVSRSRVYRSRMRVLQEGFHDQAFLICVLKGFCNEGSIKVLVFRIDKGVVVLSLYVLYVCMYVCMYVRMYVCIYIYTYREIDYRRAFFNRAVIVIADMASGLGFCEDSKKFRA